MIFENFIFTCRDMMFMIQGIILTFIGILIAEIIIELKRSSEKSDYRKSK